MISVNKSALQAALAKARLIALNNSTLPILTTVMLQARPENAWLTITASSLDAQIALDVEADIDERIDVCVDAQRLAAAVDSPGDTTKIKMDGERVKVSTGKSIFRLPYLPAADFPLVQSKSDAIASFACEWMPEVIERLLPFAATTDTRQYLNGISIGCDGTNITLTASDGHMAARDVRAVDCKAGFNIIVPRRIAAALKSINPTRAVVKGGELLLLGENVQVVSKLVEGAFPDASKFFAVNGAGSVTMSRKTAIQAVKSCCAVIDFKVKAVNMQKAVRVEDGSHVLLVSVVGNDGTDGVVEVNAKGDNFNFGLMDRVALAMLESGAEDEITLHNSDGRICLSEGSFSAAAAPYRI